MRSVSIVLVAASKPAQRVSHVVDVVLLFADLAMRAEDLGQVFGTVPAIASKLLLTSIKIALFDVRS